MSWASVFRRIQLTFSSYSILPAISLGGIVDCMIIEGSFNAETFTKFVKGLLDHMQPFPSPKSVIVMDNCSIHKAPQIRELVESRSTATLSVLLVCSDSRILGA